MKKCTRIGVLCIISILLLSSCNNLGRKEEAVNEVIIDLDTNRNSVEETPVPILGTQVPSNNEENNYRQIKEGVKSPNGEFEAEVINERDKTHDSIILTDKNNNSSKIELDSGHTGIMEFYWIDNTRIALLEHVNPSLEKYVVVDSFKKEVIEEYYGIGFVWNKNNTKLYYAKPNPHFGVGESSEHLVDSDGNILYETEKNETLRSHIVVSENEQSFIFSVDKNDDLRKLVVARLGADNKIIKQYELDAFPEDIQFKDNEHFTITDSSGNVVEYSVTDYN